MADYTEGELRLHVARERQELTRELAKMDAEERATKRRRGEITDRLGQLDKADDLLDGGL